MSQVWFRIINVAFVGDRKQSDVGHNLVYAPVSYLQQFDSTYFLALSGTLLYFNKSATWVDIVNDQSTIVQYTATKISYVIEFWLKWRLYVLFKEFVNESHITWFGLYSARTKYCYVPQQKKNTIPALLQIMTEEMDKFEAFVNLWTQHFSAYSCDFRAM